jgi:hypothetical protein
VQKTSRHQQQDIIILSPKGFEMSVESLHNRSKSPLISYAGLRNSSFLFPEVTTAVSSLPRDPDNVTVLVSVEFYGSISTYNCDVQDEIELLASSFVVNNATLSGVSVNIHETECNVSNVSNKDGINGKLIKTDTAFQA